MKRILIGIAAGAIILIGLFLIYKFFILTRSQEKGALQINTNIKAQILLNGKYVGEAPLCKCNAQDVIPIGEYELKIIPQDKSVSEFNARIKILPNVLTAVDRTFLPGAFASAYIITLEEKSTNDAELFISAIPDGALVSIDSNPSGVTPLTEKTLPPSEHEIEIQKQGFAKKTIRVRTVPGFTLIVNALLGVESGEEEILAPTEEKAPEEAATAKPKKIAEISSTPTGFLRVREGAGKNFAEVAQVKPSEKYPVLEEQELWVKIQIDAQTSGWVSSDFVSISTPE